MRNIIFAIVMALMLAGCPTQPLQVNNTEVRYEKVPKHLTEPMIPERAKPKQEYMAMSPHERESYLSEYGVYLLGIIKELNIKLNKIDKLNGQLK